MYYCGSHHVSSLACITVSCMFRVLNDDYDARVSQISPSDHHTGHPDRRRGIHIYRMLGLAEVTARDTYIPQESLAVCQSSTRTTSLTTICTTTSPSLHLLSLRDYILRLSNSHLSMVRSPYQRCTTGMQNTPLNIRYSSIRVRMVK